MRYKSSAAAGAVAGAVVNVLLYGMMFYMAYQGIRMIGGLGGGGPGGGGPGGGGRLQDMFRIGKANAKVINKGEKVQYLLSLVLINVFKSTGR